MDDIQVSEQALAPIVKTVVVPLPVEAAFRLFTAQTGQWWPLPSHSVAGDEAATCILEGQVGGRFYEVTKDGSQWEWGRVRVWEPPRRAVFDFYPGRTPESATQVEVTFETVAGGTRLTLVHSGWERSAPEVQARWAGYVEGWTYVLGRYAGHASLAGQGLAPTTA